MQKKPSTKFSTMMEALMKLGTEGIFFNIIKDTYDKKIANIILNGEN
jgi:hypothetical protein